MGEGGGVKKMSAARLPLTEMEKFLLFLQK